MKKTGVSDESWQYDAAGRAIANSQGDHDLYYSYDEVGNRESLKFVGSSVSYFTYYEHDARNMLAALTDPFAQTVYYERDELGREIAKLLPNDVTTYHNYDAASQVTSLLHVGSSGVLQSLYYSYDDDGQRTRIIREDSTRIYFGYDAAHRLTGEDWLDSSDTHLYAFDYEYDAAGNRTKKTFNGGVTYYNYNDLNQLTQELVLGGDPTYYTWTDDGAMATKQEVAGWTYFTWDVDESLTKIQAPDTTLQNKYNARMQRVERDEDGTSETLIYDAQKLIAEAGASALNAYYLSEGGSVYSPLVSQLGSQEWFLFDALGSTLGLTGSAGSLSDTFLYEAFGTSLGRTGGTSTPYQYVGGYGYFREAGVGLEQVWWRWLDRQVGRWLSRDPLVVTTKAYVYVRSMATRFIDPTGLQETSEECDEWIDPLVQAGCAYYDPTPGIPIPLPSPGAEYDIGPQCPPIPGGESNLGQPTIPGLPGRGDRLLPIIGRPSPPSVPGPRWPPPTLDDLLRPPWRMPPIWDYHWWLLPSPPPSGWVRPPWWRPIWPAPGGGQ